MPIHRPSRPFPARVGLAGIAGFAPCAAAKTIPAGRIGEPDDVARLVVFLASSQSGYITGEAIGVLGGQ